MNVKVVLAGCGNMGYAMLSGWLKSGRLLPGETFVIEPNADLRARAERLGSGVGSDAGDVPAGEIPALVVLAVKPQIIREVTAGYS
nr:NAD(P)-binding domain-containing protein [Pseudaminobacter sp.]